MNGSPVRAVVVEDSVTTRALLCEILRGGDIEVVGEAADGNEAVALVRELRPSVVLMDIQMPGVDGFEATRRIMAETPTPIVIVTASYDPSDVAVSLQATRLGALTVQPKPSGPGAPTFEADAARLVALVRAMAAVKVIGRRVPRRAAPEAEAPRAARLAPPADAAEARWRTRVVGVGASTGGPAALYRFLARLPADLRAPVLVVQHIPDGFVGGLVRWLRGATRLDVRVAEAGAALVPASVYLAPHGRHLEVGTGDRVRLTERPPAGGFRPSVSVLFASLADHYGDAAAGVVLTGMGDDGLAGARRLRDQGGLVLAQDEASSVVFGMPRAVADAGLAHAVGTVEELARRVAVQVGHAAGAGSR